MLGYPTLNLFLYDLRAGLGQNEADIEQNRADFKRKLPAHLDNALFDQLDNGLFETEYLELLGEKNKVIPLSPAPDFPKHDGYYYPVRFNDSYGLLLNCSFADNQEKSDLTWLNALQKLVADCVGNQKGTLGETWFFSAQLDYLEQSAELATKVYQTLMPDADADENQIGQSDFLGGVIFEFWGYHSQAQVKHHVIITFYTDKNVLDRETEFYPDWMRLLWYRHKITWAYNQSRQLAHKLKQGAVQIQACEQKLRDSTNVNKLGSQQLQTILNEAWHILSDYATHLDELNDQIHTIEINLGNYEKRLVRLAEKSASELTVFTKFQFLTQEKYCLQVQKDYDGFSPKLRRLENMIGYIRASVAIREETRDRDLVNTVAIWGTGLASGAIVASLTGQLPLLSETSSWWNFFISLGFSISIAIFVGLLIKFRIWLRQKPSNYFSEHL
ncbi:MAG: hypothetical protein VSS75_021935 [Candidatus Parabeggiatoa sp.]|nr:hypothetical protein [Candidatus Parabeggiatoa sp.]